MKVGIIIFAYNRSMHLQQVLEGLERNNLISKLYIFQDGLKCEDHRKDWEATTQIIRRITWCEVIYELSKENRGLANSIIYGVNKTFLENDAVIVLEDDCVPASHFIEFMMQCFEKYKSNKKVYCVSGYGWPIDMNKEHFDVYFTGRISSWGWGTWKDRWEKYNVDNNIMRIIKNDKEKSLYLATWGNDLEKMLVDRIIGKNDSWAVYWALKVIELEGICVTPYVSLIRNIGCDGSGVHCQITDKYQVALDNGERDIFELPDNIQILEKTKKLFSTLYGSYTATNFDVNKPHIIVYGIGNFFFENEKYINDHYYIEAFVDENKSGYYAGKKIIKMIDVEEHLSKEIIIMIYNIQECLKIANSLKYKHSVETKNILIGLGVVPNTYGMKSITYTENDKIQLEVDGIKCKITSLDEFNNAREVLVYKTYNYYINNDKKDVIIDIGMNIGDATLYFLKQIKTKKVYGFEPFRQTYLQAKDNLQEYLWDSDRLEIFQFGISNINEQRKIIYNKEMSCGQSTTNSVTLDVRSMYEKAGLISKENDVLESILVRKASEIMYPIVNSHMNDNIVLKMDCEGDEYEIIEELWRANLLSQIDIVMLEWHYRGKEILTDYLCKAGFSYWCTDKSEDMGLVYAINCRTSL